MLTSISSSGQLLVQRVGRQSIRNFIRSSKPAETTESEVKVFSRSERFKHFFSSRKERIVNYSKMVLDDYKEALKEVREYYKSKPIRGSVYTSLAVFSLYASYNNPDEQSFRDAYVRSGQELGQVGDLIRNPGTQNLADYVSRADNAGLIRRLNLGVVSLMWVDDYSADMGLYAARCQYLKPTWSDMRHRIVDVGFLGKWWISAKKMEKYDINESEWDEQGNPVSRSNQLKPLW